jgi:hypothetical protein
MQSLRREAELRAAGMGATVGAAQAASKTGQREGPGTPAQGGTGEGQGAGVTGAPDMAEGPEGDNESAEPALKPSREKAYQQFLWAMEQDRSLKTDQGVYDWLKKHSDEPEELPAFDTWSKYLREARAYHQDHKHTPRSIKKASGKSTVRRDQI